MTASDHAAAAILGLCLSFAMALCVYTVRTAPPLPQMADWQDTGSSVYWRTLAAY